MNRIWLIVAGCFAIVAGVFVFIGKFDGAFVSGALGVLAWFLDLRGQMNKIREHGEKPPSVEIDRLGKQDED